MSKIVTRSIDLTNPPKLSKEAKARLAKLNEAEIDYSDIPPLKDDFWANAVTIRCISQPNKSPRYA